MRRCTSTSLALPRKPGDPGRHFQRSRSVQIDVRDDLHLGVRFERCGFDLACDLTSRLPCRRTNRCANGRGCSANAAIAAFRLRNLRRHTLHDGRPCRRVEGARSRGFASGRWTTGDVHDLGPEPARWDYGDWHHAVMGEQLATNAVPRRLRWSARRKAAGLPGVGYRCGRESSQRLVARGHVLVIQQGGCGSYQGWSSMGSG